MRFTVAAGYDGEPGWSVTMSSRDPINQIAKILYENLRQGALRIGITPGYASQGTNTYELFEEQRAPGKLQILDQFPYPLSLLGQDAHRSPTAIRRCVYHAC